MTINDSFTGSTFCCQPLVHYEGVNVSLLWVIKGIGNVTNDIKAKFAPESNRSLIARRNEIELHCFIAQFKCKTLRVLAHRGGKPSASSCGGNHITAVTYMITGAGLIRFYVITAEYDTVFLCYKGASR